MAHGFEIYIDESGCEGFKFRPRPEPGSPEWFILGAVMWRVDQRSAILNHIREAQKRIAPKRAHMHFVDLSHDQRVAWIDAIVQSGAIWTTVLVNKPKLADPKTFRAKDRLYFYFTRYLLERASWYCRDDHKRLPSGNGTGKIFFSKRKTMSYASLAGYLSHLRLQAAQDEWMGLKFNDVRIDWA